MKAYITELLCIALIFGMVALCALAIAGKIGY